MFDSYSEEDIKKLVINTINKNLEKYKNRYEHKDRYTFKTDGRLDYDENTTGESNIFDKENIFDTYTENEIIQYENSNEVQIPFELRWYLINISKYIIRYNITQFMLDVNEDLKKPHCVEKWRIFDNYREIDQEMCDACGCCIYNETYKYCKLCDFQYCLKCSETNDCHTLFTQSKRKLFNTTSRCSFCDNNIYNCLSYT